MIDAEHVRYIKLGPKGRWAAQALARNELHFGYGKVTHDLAMEADIAKIRATLVEQGRDAQAATRDAQEVIDFYHLGADCLWITFAQDCLWWTFAEPEVIWLTKDLAVTGERVRKAIGGWRNTDVNGVELRTDSLSTRLTKVAGYRRTSVMSRPAAISCADLTAWKSRSLRKAPWREMRSLTCCPSPSRLCTGKTSRP
jgi:hypothetical protein